MFLDHGEELLVPVFEIIRMGLRFGVRGAGL